MSAIRVRRVVIAGVCLTLALFTTSTRAQYAEAPRAQEDFGPDRDWSDDIPAHLSVVDGEVSLERDGRLEPAEANLALLAGDRLRTSGGRAEILFADGSTLAIDEQTEVDLLDDALIRLLGGRLRVVIPRTTDDLDYQIDAAAGTVIITTAGEYRIETGVDRRGQAEVDVLVYRGSAELVNDFGRTLVRAGTHAVAQADSEPSRPYALNSAAWDEFDRWADDQRQSRLGRVSTAYLPQEVRYYSGAFDAYGTWGYEAQYGNVWYPSVADTWSPYSQGRWSFSAHFGWLWVGIDRWSWPTHHYGRWGLQGSRWFWIPGRRWAPAWVSWATAPGYVGWCPLGFDGRAVIAFRASGSWIDPFRGWTVLPSRRFNHNVWVTEHRVIRTQLTPSLRNTFVERPVAPVVAGLAVARRDLAPLRPPTAPRNIAVPRQGVGGKVGGSAGSGVGAGKFDSARVPARTSSVRDAVQGGSASKRTTDPDVAAAPARGSAAADRPGARPSVGQARQSTAPARGNSDQRAVKSVDPIDVPRVQVPRAEVPRTGAVRRASEPAPKQVPPPAVRSSQPSRSVRPPDRSVDEPAKAPPRQSAPSRQVAPPRPSTPPSAAPPRKSAPSRQVAPPRQSAPSRQVAPPRQSALPRQSAPPPSAARPRPSAPPPSASAPPSRGKTTPPPTSRGGGGATQGSANSRGRGGGGGK